MTIRTNRDRDKTNAHQALRAGLLVEMRKHFGADQHRIDHALAVLGWAERIRADEPGDPDVIVPAAILHDVGIPAAEAKHGSASGPFQEIEGPPIARRICRRVGLDAKRTEHVCRIIANHHTAGDIDSPEFRIVWDADWLVNLPETVPDRGAAMDKRIERIFKTPAGRRLARATYASERIAS
ncbi:MAG: HD domain-containing protein [Planctomycetota bacterium]